MEILEETMTFALDAFGDQARKGSLKLPAFWHSCDVAAILAQAGITDAGTLQLAYLHDILEDTSTTVEKSKRWPHEEHLLHAGEKLIVSPSIIEGIRQLTNPSHMSQEDRKAVELMMATRLIRKAARVRVADKVSNVRSLLFDRPEGWTKHRALEYVKWADEVISACAERVDSAHLLMIANETIKTANKEVSAWEK